jgi:ribosome biogenesis GTPase
VKTAVDEGRLALDRLDSYHKLRKELEYLDRKTDPAAASNVKRRWRSIHKNMRAARKKGWTRGDS